MMIRDGLFGSLNTIRAKFLALVVPLVLFATIVVFGFSEYKTQNDAELKLGDRLDKLVAIQSAVLSKPLWNVADEQIELVLSALAIDPDVLAAAVYDDNGTLVGSIGPTKDIEIQKFL